MTVTPRIGFPEPGEQLGPFRLGRRLGFGGMGVVYEALDRHLHRQVALKIIAPHLAQDAEFRARFTREARAQASLDSPHVVQVYSFGESEGRLYIASQLIPDGDLGHLVSERGVPSTRVALDLVAQIADGLADAHAAGLVHRDIKPANVLLRRRHEALTAHLTDFGIARKLDPEAGAGTSAQLTSAGAAVGTPSYMAPELHTGGRAGPLCDVYSLGCVLWTLLAGDAPYSGGTDFQVVSGHVSGPIPQVEPTGPMAVEINRVLSLVLAKEPARRYPSAVAVRDDLRRLAQLADDPHPIRPLSGVDGRPLLPPPPPPTRAVRRRADPSVAPATPTPTPAPTSAPTSEPPRRWGSVVGAVLLVAVAAAAVVAALRLGGDADPGPETVADAAARDRQAVEVLSGAFAERAGVGEDAGRCIAERVVDDVGLAGLIEAGVIDEDLGVVDEDIDDPEFISGLFSATFACAGDLGS